MFKYFLKNKFYFILIGVIIVVEPILTASLNLFFEKILNYVAPGSDLIIVIRLLLIGFFFWMTKRAIAFISSVLNSRSMCNIRNDIKNDTFKNLLNMDVSELENISASGEYASVFLNDINIIEERYFKNIINFIASVIAFCINVAALSYMNYKLAIPIVIFAFFIAFIPLIFTKQLAKSHYNYSIKIAQFTQKIKEFIQAYPTIKNYEVEDPVYKRFQECNMLTEDSKFTSEYDIALSNSISSLFSWFMQIIAIGVGFALVIKGEILLGTVIAARGFANDIAEPLNNAVSSLNSILSIREINKKIRMMTFDKIKRQEIEVEFNGGDLNYSHVNLELDGDQIIDNFSFNFEEGKKYLIIGKNGAGKSSIFKLLKKRYREYSGDIKVGSVDLREVPMSELSHRVSYLNEKVDLFTGTILNNITLFSKNYSKEQISDAIKKAQLNVDLNREVNDSGFSISSGEKRRVEIARSLLRGSNIIIFDEVVSTLDVITAYEIENTILNYDKTIIFISHNFSAKLIKKYDEILILDGGKLVDHGTFDNLISRNEYFRNICSIKFGATEF